MGIFKFFQKKEPEEKKIEKVEVRPRPLGRKISVQAAKVLASPHVTERATALTEKDKYVFKVFPRTNKTEVKKAIEGLYGVDVVDVRIINIPKKQRKLGKQTGWRKGYKKAIVKIKKGQKIEILPR